MEENIKQYQGCPGCGGQSLTEWTHELANQSGVRLTADGHLDYDASKGMQIEGDTIKVTGYKCDACKSELIICNGKLTGAPHELSTDSDAIPAYFRLDNGNTTISFDATPWFATAEDDKILALAMSGFAYDYPADNVAIEMAEHVTALQAAFALHEELGGGTSCAIHALEAMAWIKANRPHIYASLETNEDIPEATAIAIRDLNA